MPSHDDRHLFEMLVLEGAQAGLSWSTILHKREGYRRAFDGFDPARVARFTPARVERLLSDAAIVRNRAKIEAAIANGARDARGPARRGSLDAYLWSFVGGEPVFEPVAPARARSRRDRRLAGDVKDLKRRGFRFVGPTICYAFMQATGMVNDHLTTCFRYAPLAGGRA